MLSGAKPPAPVYYMYLWLSEVFANEWWSYINNIFSHWLGRFLAIVTKQALISGFLMQNLYNIPVESFIILHYPITTYKLVVDSCTKISHSKKLLNTR